MRYDPVKDVLGGLVRRHPILQRCFFRALDVIFLRAWYVRREIRRLLAGMHTPPLRVLDAGTGFGQYAYFMIRTYPEARVHAVDIKDDYLASLQHFVEQTPYRDRLTVAVDDLRQLQAPGPYDLILSVDVMEHIDDDRAVFRHFARVLAPGGYVLVNTPSDLGGSDVHGEEDSSFIEEHVRNGYNRAELQGKLSEAGLETERSLYTYGSYGSLAWRLLIKYPILLAGRSKILLLLLPFYYLPVLPIGLLLNALDMRRDNPTGTGLLVVAHKAGLAGPRAPGAG